MNYLRKVVDWIDSLESGRQFRKWVSILVKILGVLVLVGAIVWGIVICVTSISIGGRYREVEQTLIIIGSILALCINVIVGIVIASLFWNRSNKISGLGDDSHFALLPIAVILIRLFGEVSFLSFIGTGVQGLIASIFGSGIPGLMDFLLRDLRLPGNVSFIVGVISLIASVLTGVILLIIHYFIAELVNLFLDMATNLKKIETTLSDEEATPEL